MVGRFWVRPGRHGGCVKIALVFMAGVVAFLFLLQCLMWLQARRSQGQPAPDTSGVDGAAVTDPVRVYYFYAVHCGPCRAMVPLVDRLCASHRNLIKLNVAESRELARDFGVTATPSFIQVVDGIIRQVKLGGQSEAKLLTMLQFSSQERITP